MNRYIAALNERNATFRQVKGSDSEEMEKLAKVGYREEMPEFSLSDSERDGWSEEDDNSVSMHDARGYGWNLTSEMVDGLED